MKSPDVFYITTAISYPNGRPHIGHAYEVIATDCIARYHRLCGRTVLFLTGTDEHGLKIAQAARAAGLAPKAYVDSQVAAFQQVASTFDISHDRFIRTTDRDHYAASQALWRAMVAAGDIYLGRYDGWYSVRDEAYYDESELIDATDAGGNAVRLSPQGTAVEWTVEESWFFRLSAYADRLLAWFDANPGCVAPPSRMNEMRAFVTRGLRDLSISRTSFDWGVPVPDAAPGSPPHVMYVWVDALTNYLTGAGYPADGYDRIWPADLHVIGKDVVRFHAVYWPAFLMSAGLALPERVFGHGFILDRGGDKMSKSAGNVVDPLELAATLGVDRLRWFMLREVAFGDDGSYSHSAIVERTNADLANGIGNLAQRALSMIAKNCNGLMPPLAVRGEAELALAAEIASETRLFHVELAALRLHRALEAVMAMVTAANAYFADAAPWGLKVSDPVRMAGVLGATVDAVRRIAMLAQPALPGAMTTLLDQLGVSPDARAFAAVETIVAAGTALPPPTGVFPRWVD